MYGSQPFFQGDERQHTGNSLGKEGRPGHTCHAPVKDRHKKHIQKYISDGGTDQKIQRRFGISQRGENSGSHIIQEKKNKPAYVNPQIQITIRKYIIGSIDHDHQPPAPRQAHSRKHCGQRQ